MGQEAHPQEQEPLFLAFIRLLRSKTPSAMIKTSMITVAAGFSPSHSGIAPPPLTRALTFYPLLFFLFFPFIGTHKHKQNKQHHRYGGYKAYEVGTAAYRRAHLIYNK